MRQFEPDNPLSKTGTLASTLGTVQPRLFIIDISTIPERLHRTESAGKGTSLAQGVSPSIVLVFYYLAAVCVNQRDDVALQVVQVGVSSSLNKTTAGLFCPS